MSHYMGFTSLAGVQLPRFIEWPDTSINVKMEQLTEGMN